ncbi:Putative adenylate/guanylate cyclase [Pseudomonas sp. 9AZ]|uniref:TRAFs-binding domain-containing protein n=1 Tax=Pseudomonas sp. 9AZ TaxID=2653168 RepID=UPI0012EF4AA9|nr:TRAFs-binding domain-containing protein [Pseudomonas sp. 9AZ]VXD00160.1 Putative adenylate/guanylate cyclase [Pseudomonas sp. 9AZ]
MSNIPPQYKPTPIDTSAISLDSTLQPLLEKLAENTHEIWAKQRMDEGWHYGPERNDRLCQHSCLVPYSDLPESEKNYDRATSQETLRLIIKLGYTLLPPSRHTLTDLHQQQLNQLASTLQQPTQTTADLVKIWQHREPGLWQLEPQLYVQLGSFFLKRGEPLLAYDVFSDGRTSLPAPEHLSDDQRLIYTRLCQQQALALAETGAIQEASMALQQLLQCSQHLSPETLGILGRTYKEMALALSVSREDSQIYIAKAYAAYFQAYEQALASSDWDFAYYTGINAATVARISGDVNRAQELASAVLSLCNKLLASIGANTAPYWLYATIGEAELLSGRPVAAQAAYAKAVQRCKNDHRALMSMRKQILLLNQHANIAITDLLTALPSPTLCVFSGHRIDIDLDIDNPRFPAENEIIIRQKIDQWLAQFHHVIAYCSAANGSDLLFIEQVLARGGEVNIILPFERAAFAHTSVRHPSDQSWGKRFVDALHQATRVVELTEYNPAVSDPAYAFTNLCIAGMAQARQSNTRYPLRALTVWDGLTEGGLGGTYSAICHWRAMGLDIDQIHPGSGVCQSLLTTSICANSAPPQKTRCPQQGVDYYQYLPMLFADIKGYSKLNEQQLVTFSTVYLDTLKRVFDEFPEGVLSRRTQGDGLFLVFSQLSTAVAVALRINAVLAGTAWGKVGLPADLQIRISLDAGPCYAYPDHIVGATEFCGHYVIRAARLEPVTPPGHIFATETFVALCYANSISSVRFVYAGQIALPKGHGIIPAYHLLEELR